MKSSRYFLSFLSILLASHVLGQKDEVVLQDATVEQCVQYALQHQPAVNQSMIDEQITDKAIKSKLADWLPQINLTANYQNNFMLPSTKFGNQVITIGAYNTSYANFELTQTIFDRDVLLIKSSEKDIRTQARQASTNTKIAVAANVSKAFFDVLLTIKQIELLDEDIILLKRTQSDTYNQYKGGLVDKTDYSRATISLNNALARRKTSDEELKSKFATLKLLMSYPQKVPLSIMYDTLKMRADVYSIDTTEEVNFNNRIEYQLMLTQKKLQEANLRYYKWGFLPTLSAYGQYNFNYFSNEFSKLYNDNFPSSFAGVTLTFPIFQGTKRTQQIRMAELQLNRLDYDFVALKDSIGAQYTQAIAAYRANLQNFYVQKENLQLAKDVYNIIQLQYRQGIKSYLDVVTANDDLFTAQINYTNAAFQVLINRIDVQLALGTLQY